MTPNTRSSDNSPPSKKPKTSESPSQEDSSSDQKSSAQSTQASSKIQNGSKGADHEVQGEHNEWKFRAPYQLHEEGTFEKKFEGGCHCGRVKYHIKATEPLESKYCHCTTCQALHGSPFGWTAVFNKEDVKFVNGHHDLTWYDSMEKTTRHKLPCKVTCSYCHASVMDEGNNKLLLYPGTIKYKNQKEKEHFKGTYHMFYGERLMDINDGLPKWEGMKEKSKLLEE